MSAAAGTLVGELGRALREVRWQMRVSQRELAEQHGVSKSWVGRVESGEVSAALAVVSRVAADLGLSIALSVGSAADDLGAAPAGSTAGAVLDDVSWLDDAEAGHGDADRLGADHVVQGQHACAEAAVLTGGEVGGEVGDQIGGPRPWQDAATPGTPRTPAAPAPLTSKPAGPPLRGRDRSRSFEADPQASALVERWRERTERERVRDAAGRRMPAHLVGYPMSYPHHWWVVRHPRWSLRRRPIWSFTFRTPTADAVLLVGDNPPPLGLHPDGGWPMQGHPGEQVRAQWPPTFPVRPRWYPPPLSGS